MKYRSYLENKGKEVRSAEKWARGIRKAALVISAVFSCTLLFRAFSIAIRYDDIKLLFVNLIIVVAVDVPLIVTAYFVAMLLELRASDVHSKNVLANCALYKIYSEKDEKYEDEDCDFEE